MTARGGAIGSAARMQASLEHTVRVVAGWMAWAAFGALIMFGCAYLTSSLSHGGFSEPNEGMRELSDLVVPVGLTAFFPLAFVAQRNIAGLFLGGGMGPRTKATMGVVIALLVSGVVAAFAWRFSLYAKDVAWQDESTIMMHLPKAPFWQVVAANLWLTLVAQVVVFLGQLVALSEAIAEVRRRPRWLR